MFQNAGKTPRASWIPPQTQRLATGHRFEQSWCWWLIILIMLIGAALRIGPLTDNRLHPDEALFATLARLIITGQDPLLKDTWLLVDKPPLFYYTLAGGVSICWGCEISARLPGLFASIISIALVARVACILWHSRVASVVSTLIYALSPLAISFSATVFADPQMVFWLLASLSALSLRHWGWGGLFFGFALATKESALFVLPILIIVGIVQTVQIANWKRILGIGVPRFVIMLVAEVALMSIWDMSRGANQGFLDAAIQANNPGRLIRSSEVITRISAWWQWGTYTTGEGWLTSIAVAIVGILTIFELGRRNHPRQSAVTLVVITFLCGYIGFHWIVAFPVLDRYLLPLVPLLALLLGRAISLIEQFFANNKDLGFRVANRLATAILITVALAPSALRAMGSGFPVGGDHGAYDGIDLAAAFLRNLPDGTIVYHDGLGWSLSYYLFDSDVIPVSVNSPDELERDLEAFGSQSARRYLILQGWVSHGELLRAAQSAGYEAEKTFETQNRYLAISFTVYQLTNYR